MAPKMKGIGTFGRRVRTRIEFIELLSITVSEGGFAIVGRRWAGSGRQNWLL